MSPELVEPFPFVRAAELASESSRPRWLIESLWAAEGVGVVGGHPKCCKSWLGLEMAVSVASATPCLGAFPTSDKGHVLLYMAEDSAPVVRERLDALCRHRNLCLDDLDIFVITVDRLRIDIPDQQARLRETVASLKPTLLLLDPLVRLHAIDENSAGEVSAMLAYLRALQRAFNIAIVLVHHARKSGAGQPGQALRGSGDLHAFGDSNLYLRRKGQQLILTIEHRAAPSPDSIVLTLDTDGSPHLSIVEGMPTAPPGDLDQALLSLLAQVAQPLTRTAIRQRLKARNERVGQAIESLVKQDAIHRTATGWCLSPSRRSRSHSQRSTGPELSRSNP